MSSARARPHARGRSAVAKISRTSPLRSSGEGNVPTLRASDLLAAVPGLDAIADVEPVDWGLIPASHLSFDHVLDIFRGPPVGAPLPVVLAGGVGE